MNIGAVVGLLQLGPGPGAPGPRRRCQEERTWQRGLKFNAYCAFSPLPHLSCVRLFPTRDAAATIGPGVTINPTKQRCQRGGFHLGQFLFTYLVKNSCLRLREVCNTAVLKASLRPSLYAPELLDKYSTNGLYT